MIETLRDRPQAEHVSNLAAMIAYEIAQAAGIPSYIYDSVAVDELDDIARITGLAEIRRRSLSHALNMRAAALRTAVKMGKPYAELHLIVAHLGGGITLSLHRKGRMADIVSDDEGTFSPERSGGLPSLSLADLCFSGTYDKAGLKKKCRGQGGLVSLLGTADAQEVERRIQGGDDQARLVYSAMAYQIAKGIGQLATVVDGQVDRIILTGGSGSFEAAYRMDREEDPVYRSRGDTAGRKRAGILGSGRPSRPPGRGDGLRVRHPLGRKAPRNRP